MSFYANQEHVANKEFECNFCKKKIKVGEKYFLECLISNRDTYTRNLCKQCEKKEGVRI